ncbi:MAG: hypothetical protein WCK84_01850 [Bacteroidota bacterium]
MACLKKFFIPIILLGFIVVAFSACQVAKQAKQASELANCDFRIFSVDSVNLDGVMIQNIKSVNDLNFNDFARIMAGFASPIFPLSLQVNIEGRNPNAKDAGLNRLEWILFIDENQMASGILDKPILLKANSTSIVPVRIGVDLKQVLSGKSANALINFCINLNGMGNVPTRFKIKLKPTVIVSGKALTYPGYITVNTTYSSK